jgi:geranylgeranyl pyrophosphate synthase
VSLGSSTAAVSASSSTPPWLADGLARVESLLTSAAGASPHPLVSEPSLHLIRAGGKRLRPALVLLTSHAGVPGQHATDLAAAAIELVHIATLYHDDVLDATETRRGVSTAHSKWGTEVAVLAGDFLFACGSALGAEASGAVPGILARAIAEVCEGQILETGTLGDPERPVSGYIDVIERKTAALFRAACELGATTSGATTAQRAALMDYGLNLGLAFQIVDDLLDLVGDPNITGKRLGTDLREGVFTVPVLIACARRGSLTETLRSGDRDLATVMDAVVKTGALSEAYELAWRHGRQALAALAPVADGDWATALEGLVDGVLAQVKRPEGL